jgi:hypothetical protein
MNSLDGTSLDRVWMMITAKEGSFGKFIVVDKQQR